MAIMYKSVKGASAVQPTGNAVPADVLSGKTFSNADGVGKTGTMVNNGAVSGVATPSQPYTIPEGYHNGSGTVTGSATRFVKGFTKFLSGAYNNSNVALANEDPNDDILYNEGASPTATLDGVTVTVTGPYPSYTYTVSSTSAGKLYMDGTLVKTWSTGDMSDYTISGGYTIVNHKLEFLFD